MVANFSRGRGIGNAAVRRWWSVGISLLTGGLILTGCSNLPRVPSNVILRDVHNSGYALAFDRESKILATGGTEGWIRLWSLPQAKEIKHWSAHDGSLQGLHFIHQDRTLLSASYDGELARWTREGALRQRAVADSPILDVVVDETDGLIVTGHDDGTVRLWRLNDFSPIQKIAVHDGQVLAVHYHRVTRTLASSGTDGKVFHWRMNQTPKPLPAPPMDAHDLAFTPDGKWLIGSGWFNLYRWRTDRGSLELMPTEHRGLIKSISMDHSGRRLATIGRHTDSAVYLMDPRTGNVLERFQPHQLCGTVVQLSPNGRYLASTSDDANVQVWDLKQLLPKQTFYSE